MILGKDYNIAAVSPKEWNILSENAHLSCFKEKRPPSMNTFDYCLVAFSPDDVFSYATIIEMDAKTAYMQHGGALPTIKGTINVKRIYTEKIAWLKARYAQITTRIQNTNLSMLKLAFSEGLLVHGCDCYPDGIFLHLRWAK